MRSRNQARVPMPKEWSPNKISNDLWLIEGHTLTRLHGKWYLLCGDTEAGEHPVPVELSEPIGASLHTAIIVLEDHLKDHHA